jgi:nucleoside-diphosphate-sugar epimerase
MAKLLVAGGTGLIGAELVRQAAAAGHELVLLCRQDPGLGLPTLRADLSDASALARRLPQERFDAVLYLAQPAEHHAFPANASAAVALNIASPIALCQWAAQAGCPQFVYASSGGICGAGHDAGQRITEDWRPRPSADLPFYLATKARCEELLAGFGGLLQVDVLRYFFVYGAGQRPGFLIPRLAGKIRAGEPVDLAGGVGPLLNPIHASDAAALTLAAVGTTGPRITNIAGTEDTTLAAIVHQIAGQVGRAAVVAAGPGEPPVYLADTARMRARLGTPRVRLADGIALALRAQEAT